MQHPRKRVLTLLGALLWAAVAIPSLAGSVMVYEGLLQEADGSLVVHATHGFDFTLFAGPEGGSPLWREIHQGVLVDDGRYAVTLGLVVPFDLPDGDYWLEIAVDGEVATPRTKTVLAKGNCTIDGNLTVLNGNLGVGTSNPHHEAEIYGNDSEAGLRLAWGPTYGNLFADFKMATGTGLTINSNAGGTWADMHLQTNGTTKLYIDSSGLVGIGTTVPETKLEVWGDGRFGDWSQPATIQGAKLHVHNNAGTGRSILVTDYSFPSTVAFVVEGGGDVGIGKADPTHLLDVGNSGAYCDGGAWVNGSSRTFKDNIVALTDVQALDTLNELEPTSFTYKSDSDEVYLGFIAEDVPELVATNDRKGIVTMDVVAVLTKVVQLQQAQIDALQEEMATIREGRR
jgi:hypothetical protein